MGVSLVVLLLLPDLLLLVLQPVLLQFPTLLERHLLRELLVRPLRGRDKFERKLPERCRAAIIPLGESEGRHCPHVDEFEWLPREKSVIGPLPFPDARRRDSVQREPRSGWTLAHALDQQCALAERKHCSSFALRRVSAARAKRQRVWRERLHTPAERARDRRFPRAAFVVERRPVDGHPGSSIVDAGRIEQRWRDAGSQRSRADSRRIERSPGERALAGPRWRARYAIQ